MIHIFFVEFIEIFFLNFIIDPLRCNYFSQKFFTEKKNKIKLLHPALIQRKNSHHENIMEIVSFFYLHTVIFINSIFPSILLFLFFFDRLQTDDKCETKNTYRINSRLVQSLTSLVEALRGKRNIALFTLLIMSIAKCHSADSKCLESTSSHLLTKYRCRSIAGKEVQCKFALAIQHRFPFSRILRERVSHFDDSLVHEGGGGGGGDVVFLSRRIY